MMEAPKEAILQLIEDIPFFDGFTQDEIMVLLDCGQWIKAMPGKRIITEGEIDLRMFILIVGRGEVVLNEKILAVLNTGDIFGEFGLMGTPRMAHVEAQTECMILSFGADQLNKLPLDLQLKLLRRILLVIFTRLQKLNQREWLRRQYRKGGSRQGQNP
jgi:CRP-like cAMP-binding protein